MAIKAFAFAGDGFFDHSLMGRLFIEFRRVRMAIEANGEIVGLAHFDR
jgi:hypothetical protein